MNFFRRKSDKNPPPPIPEAVCPLAVGQMIEGQPNTMLHILSIRESHGMEKIPGMAKTWQVSARAIYKIPQYSSDITIDPEHDQQYGKVYDVRYKGPDGNTFLGTIVKSWVRSEIDQYNRRLATNIQITEVETVFHF